MRYKKILWDFDGTLAYTSKDVWNSLEYAAGICGGKLPKDFIGNDSHLGKPMKEIFDHILPAPDEEKYEMFEELVRVHYRTLSEYKDTCFYPGIQKLLTEMTKAGVSHYIITMKPEEALKRILKKKGWLELFEGFCSPDSFPGEEKTKSELIAHVLQKSDQEKSGLGKQGSEKSGLEKSQYVYIGDTWSDVQAANENGIDCIGVAYGDGDTERLLACHPKYYVQDVSEMKSIVKEGV